MIASLGGSGGYAERVAVPAASLIDVPDALALDDAVALLADGRTATMLAEAAASPAGERVLILAAAGGVGTLLVQLARGGRARRWSARSAATPSAAVVASLGGEGVRYDDARGPVRRGLRRRRRRGRALGVRAARAAAGGCSRYGLASGTWAADRAPRRPRRAASRSSSPTATRRRCAATPSARWPRACAGHRAALSAGRRRRRPRRDRGARDDRKDTCSRSV